MTTQPKAPLYDQQPPLLKYRKFHSDSYFFFVIAYIS
jgi:hypothetical protein